MAKQLQDSGGESAQDRILAAARLLFTKQGYDAVKTRDIAAAAGENLALVNYYFRSKELLFERIMHENFDSFLHGITEVINNKETTLEEKIDSLVETYMNMLEKNPDMPLFVINNISHDQRRIKLKETMYSSVMIQQLNEGIKKKLYSPIQPIQFILNVLGLTVFPFIARPMLMTGLPSEEEANIAQAMAQRRHLVAHWIKSMLKTPFPPISSVDHTLK